MTVSPLRAALDSVVSETGCSMQDLTVLAAKNDPFRIDTPARRNEAVPSQPPDFTPWHELFHWLKYHGEHRVFIPYAGYLAEHTAASAVRMRRDFGTLLGMIEAHAILHQLTRDRDEHGRIIASAADYEAARDILADAFAVSSGRKVRDSIRRAVTAVLDLGGVAGADGRDVTVAQVAKHLKRDRTRATRGLKDAADLGFLVNREERSGRAALYHGKEVLMSGSRFSRGDYAAVSFRDAAIALWGDAAAYAHEAYARLRPALFPELPGQIPLVIGITAYGHCDGLTRSGWEHGPRISLFSAAFGRGARYVDDLMAHEMLHAWLAVTGRQVKHDSADWYDAIRRLSPAVLGRELDARRGAERKSVRVPNPAYVPGRGGPKTIVRKQHVDDAVKHADVARWPMAFRLDDYDWGTPIPCLSY